MLTGFASGLRKKREMLQREGIAIKPNGKIDLTAEARHRFA
jgi:alkylated DNA nucleotide flippase Atl1